ncbi:hypothetical protein ACSBR2_040310 [Camellia fascicularis]
MKGRELEYTKTLQFLISMDLSNNGIVGEIPEELMDLSGLLNLNLSGNHLKGRIPNNIGNLTQLESLDLSRNKLFGPIPPSLSSLSYLGHLNMSFNNLSGRIPTGNQLRTLDDPSIYIGNDDGLCGAPLNSYLNDKSFDGDHKHVDESEVADETDFLWFYTGIGPGFLFEFLGVCGTLNFKKSWRTPCWPSAIPERFAGGLSCQGMTIRLTACGLCQYGNTNPGFTRAPFSTIRPSAYSESIVTIPN